MSPSSPTTGRSKPLSYHFRRTLIGQIGPRPLGTLLPRDQPTIDGQLLAELDRGSYVPQRGAHHLWQRGGVSSAHLAANGICSALIPARMAEIDGPGEDLPPRWKSRPAITTDNPTTLCQAQRGRHMNCGASSVRGPLIALVRLDTARGRVFAGSTAR